MELTFTQREELRHLSMQKFIEAAAAQYGMAPSALAALLEDYDMCPKGAWGPAEDEPLEITIPEIARRVDLPPIVIERLQRMGVLHDPISCGEFNLLKMLGKMWGDAFFLRSQLASYSRKQREDLITRPVILTDWERWAYGLFFFERHHTYYSKTQRRNDIQLIHELAESIQCLFQVKKCADTIDRIQQIKELAGSDSRRIRRGAISRQEVLANRSIPNTFVELEIELFGDDVMYS